MPPLHEAHQALVALADAAAASLQKVIKDNLRDNVFENFRYRQLIPILNAAINKALLSFSRKRSRNGTP